MLASDRHTIPTTVEEASTSTAQVAATCNEEDCGCTQGGGGAEHTVHNEEVLPLLIAALLCTHKLSLLGLPVYHQE